MNILITGGASGLGEAVTKKLASNASHKIFFTYSNSAANAKSIENEFSNCEGIKCNFKNSEEVSALAEKISVMDIDVLINNAISNPITIKHFQRTDISVFRDGFLYNVLPLIQITQKAIVHFRKKKFGKIINVLSSYVMNTPPAGLSEYVAAKSYIASLSRSWASENSKFNVTSNSVSPSFMLTNLNAETDERIVDDMKNNHPLKTLLTVEEAAESINFLVNCSQQINGINLPLNAGVNVV